MADSSCLAARTAALDGNLDIELVVCSCENEGLTHDNLKGLKSEILIDGTAVDHDVPLARNHEYTGDGLLSAACSVIICNFSHFLISSLNSELELFGLLCLMLMLGSSVYMQLGVKLVAERPLGEHTADSVLDNPLRMRLEHLAECELLVVSDILGVVPVHLLVQLLTCNLDLLCIYYDHIITRVKIGGVDRLILSSKDIRYLCGETSQSLICRINDIPFLLHL